MKSQILFIILLFSVTSIFAQQKTYDNCIKPVPTNHALVHDYAGILSPGEKSALESKLFAFEQSEDNEIVIVIIDNTCDLEIEDYANQLGRKWKIGKKNKNNGIVLLAAMGDRKVFIKTGEGLEGAVPDVIAGRIVRNTIVPYFKQGGYYQGLDKATDALMAATRGEYERTPQADDGFPLLLLLLIGLGIFMFFIFIFRNRENIYVSRRGSRYGGGWDNLPRSGGGFGGGWGGGFGGGSSGGRGFGGFGGGGGFSGGGAGGSW